MAKRTEADPSELLAKALDLAVGGVALARYAAGQTTDRRLRRTFRQLESSGEHQARVLRTQLAGLSVPAVDRSTGSTVGQFIAGALAATIAIGGAWLAYRVATASEDDGVRRAVLGLFGSTRRSSR